jgi:hypothetical protein
MQQWRAATWFKGSETDVASLYPAIRYLGSSDTVRRSSRSASLAEVVPCRVQPCIHCLGTFWNRSAILRWSKPTPTHQHGSVVPRASNHGCRKKLPIRNRPMPVFARLGPAPTCVRLRLFCNKFTSLPLEALASHPVFLDHPDEQHSTHPPPPPILFSSA